MLTGKRFWTLALVLGLCVLATAGCRRKSSKGTTINTSGIFTTDTFPGAPVQDGNVSDDKRAMSNSGEDYNNDILCTANGDRGTMMLTYTTDQGLYAHYYDGSTWTPPVALRAADADTSGVSGDRVVHAFINTDGHTDPSAEARSGDCLIFWVADDFDNDPTTTPDETNECVWMTYFDVTKVADSTLNYGFDHDPSSTPGIFYADRVNGTYDDSGEDIGAIGLVTNGLCGEARWYDGFADYSYGNETTNIYVFWHQIDEKSPGVFDQTTAFSLIDLDGVVDADFPLVSSSATELVIQTFGAADTGVDALLDSRVDTDYMSYNNVLFRRVLTDADNTDGGFDDTNSLVGTDDDCTIQESHFDLVSGLIVTDNIDTVDADSSTLNTTEQNANWLQNSGCVFGSDEGLSCIVIYFVEIVDGDLDTDLGEVTYDVSLCIAEIDEFGAGGFLNDTENQFIDFEDTLIFDNVDEFSTVAQISRNGDYIWVAFEDENDDGAFNDTGLWASQYLTTRLDSDGNPVAIPSLTVTKGVPIAVNADRDGVSINWFLFQDNLGYICGHQSDAQEMNLFYETYTTTFTEDNIDRVRLVADVDGAVGSEALHHDHRG